ncbi:MAG: phenylalanine--tRNA ligase subunit beta [Bacterioplanes sp.]|nr:phenylalanine--tRNA ligase subunit beta [Bacterioplanes sp.]
MKFSEQWLREWVQPNVNTQELADQLTMAGLEIDGTEAVAGEFSGVVVGLVTAREQHPDADKLSVCQVTDGTETFQIVCGAANVREGLKVPMAKIGAVLPGDFKIKKAKLRGVESFGMLCAEAELGLAESSDGLMELPESAPVGEDIRTYLNLNDAIIDVDLTPNRGDCLSIAGLAREVGVLNKCAVTVPAIPSVAAEVDDVITIDVQASAACPRYLGRIIKGINVAAPTPLWMVEKLRRGGVRSIDAVVDITNYVLLELGQPMHAFDLAHIQGGICVRMSQPEEQLTLLDGQEITLNPDVLVIADQQKALAMAGVMGGEGSGVNSNTQDVLLEAAFFQPLAIAGRARAYGLHTDSSHRFERGVDFNMPRMAMERATALLLSICGGQPGPIVEQSSADALPTLTSIVLRKARIEQVLGLPMVETEVEDILTRLGLTVGAHEQGWLVTPPSYRFDIAIEADLIEELARIYGYNRLPVRTPAAATPLAKRPESTLSMQDLRRALIARGLNEAITYSFVEPQAQKRLDPEVDALALLNPISADMSVMRTNLWAGLASAAAYNVKRQQPRVRLFETGLRFVPSASGLQQIPTLAMLITGARLPQSWSAEPAACDFYDLKGDFESVLVRTGMQAEITFSRGSHPALHPGQSAQIEKNGAIIGHMGALHPSVQKSLGFKQAVFVLQVDLDAIRDVNVPSFADLSKYPEMRRDLALLVAHDVSVDQVFTGIKEAAGDHLCKLNLFDVYVGKGIDSDRKSLALGLTWQHPSRTLTDEEVNSSVAAVLSHLEKQVGATLRG